jgi:protein-S-isoprenylcysteine O-methyltransferase Ste14
MRSTVRGEVQMDLKRLVGSGDRIGLFTLPFLVVGLVTNVAFPSLFGVGGPPPALALISAIVLVPGITIWIWSVVLIVTKVSRGELITSGPYALVKHPLYTDVSLLVLPWLGFLLNTWLGAALGIVLYVGSRLFERSEEMSLSETFGEAWAGYCSTVKIRWI